MRILAVHPGPAFSVSDVHQGWVRAFRDAGCQVVDFNLNDRADFYDKIYFKVGDGYEKPLTTEDALRLACKGIEVACYEFWPDIVFITSGFYVPVEVYPILRDRGHRVVLLHTESPYEDDRQIARAQHADLNLVNDPTNLERFPAGTLYMPHAYDQKLHHPGRSDHKSDFAFVGTGYPSRERFFEQVDWSGIDALFAGNWQGLSDGSPLRPLVAHDLGECLPNETTADVYRGTRASANLYRTEAERPDSGATQGTEVRTTAEGVAEVRRQHADVGPRRALHMRDIGHGVRGGFDVETMDSDRHRGTLDHLTPTRQLVEPCPVDLLGRHHRRNLEQLPGQRRRRCPYRIRRRHGHVVGDGDSDGHLHRSSLR